MKREQNNIRRPAFTLVEILIVVGILVILVTVGMVAGKKVKDSSRIKSTKITLKELQLGWENEIVAKSGDMKNTSPPLSNTTTPFSDTTLFVQILANGGPEAKKIVTRLGNAKDVPVAGTAAGTFILDAWQNPIRYVPGQTDAAGKVVKEGYFYSCGPDGLDQSPSGTPPSPPRAMDDIRSTDSL